MSEIQQLTTTTKKEKKKPHKALPIQRDSKERMTLYKCIIPILRIEALK
jgi:hypothetical protein